MGGGEFTDNQYDTLLSLLKRNETAKGKQKAVIANLFMEQLLKEGFIQEQIQFGENFSPDSINCQVWYWAGERLYAGHHYKEALEYSTKALPLCEGTNMEADCLNLLSLCSFRLSQYGQAAEYAKRCYELDEQTGDIDLMSSSLNTIAGIYLAANQPKEGEKYILKAIGFAQKANNPQRMAVIYGMASEIYHAMGNDATALEYIDLSYSIENQLGRDDRMMVRLAQKSSVLLGLHDYVKAEEVLEKIIPFFQQTGDMHSLAISCNKMGMALLSQEKYTEAIKYYREAAGIFLKIGDMRNEMHSRKGLYESLWSMDPDSAKIELERFNDLKDSLYSNSAAESLARYNAEFGSDWLKIENERQKTMALRIIIGASILLLAVALGIWSYMNKRMKIHDEALNTVIDELKNNTSLSHTKSNDQSESLSQTEKYFLEQLVDYITKNMAEGDLSVESLSSMMCITRGQLNRRVKSITGITTQQYISRVRMEYARILLEHEHDLSIYDISCKCGFEDASSFSRAFRRTFDISPIQCRNKASEHRILQQTTSDCNR